ncbi:MAG: VOC family protein [Solirubrobacteraceae bacterium]
MGQRTKYAPGAFSWTDLTTTNQEAAKVFYGELFGWETTEMPVGDGIFYSMMSIGGQSVAAISSQPQQQREAGVPPVWNSYVTVESADDALARAAQLGATVHAPAFDVMDAGRMGVVQDPQGAFFLVWEPKARLGADVVNAHGALSWNDLASPDMDASARFYRELFGWVVEPVEGSEPQMPYMTIKTGDGGLNGGMRHLTPPGTPPHWLVYFGIDDLDAGLAKVSELGGARIVEPMDIGPGRIAIVRDPQGAVFALYAGQLDP